MTLLTKAMIAVDERVYAGSILAGGQYAMYVGTYDESPSGCTRPRPMLTSRAIYQTSEEAVQAGKDLIAKVKEEWRPR